MGEDTKRRRSFTFRIARKDEVPLVLDFHKLDALRLALLAYITCILIQSGGVGGLDTYRRLGATHALWTSAAPVDPAAYPSFGIRGRGGVIQTWYGIGQSLVMLPGDIVGTALAARIHGSAALKTRVRIAAVAYMTFPIIDAMAIAVAFHLLCALGLRIGSSAVGALGLLLLTSFLHYSQNHQENNLMLLCTLTLYWSAAKWSSEARTWPWVVLGAFAAGFNLLIRVTTILDFAGVLPFTMLMLWRAKAASGELDWWRKLRPVVMVGLPILLATVAIDRLYHFHRFGTFFGTYLDLFAQEQRRLKPALPPDFPFSESFSTGFFGPFVSIRKSIFLFDPTVLFAAAGLLDLLPASRGRRLPPTRAILIGALIQLLVVVAFYAKYFDWSGDVAWGDRFITVPLHLMCMVGISLAVESWVAMSLPSRLVVGALCIIALFVQLASIVFLPALEAEQEETYGHQSFVIGQRFENIAGLFTGQLQSEANKSPHWDAAKSSLAPFTLGDLLPGRLSRRAVQLTWGVLVLLDGICLILFIRRVTGCGTNSARDQSALRASF
jgi:hypothetical protein